MLLVDYTVRQEWRVSHQEVLRETSDEGLLSSLYSAATGHTLVCIFETDLKNIEIES